jgi:hypothetical protein
VMREGICLVLIKVLGRSRRGCASVPRWLMIVGILLYLDLLLLLLHEHLLVCPLSKVLLLLLGRIVVWMWLHVWCAWSEKGLKLGIILAGRWCGSPLR